MKRLLALMTAGCLAFGISGCNTIGPQDSSTISPSIGTTGHADTVIQTDYSESSMYAVVLTPVSETVSAEDGTALFSLNYQNPQILLHHPSLEEQITGDVQRRMNSVLSDAEQIKDQAQSDHQETDYWSEYFCNVSYTPTRLDHAVLSLFGNYFSYSGGPHPSLITDSVNYDLQTGNVMFLDDVLTAECTADTLYQLILSQLSEQADDLYYDYADALGDRFTGELHSIQDWYFSREGLCFHFAPYDIAPYSSGTIIAEISYNSLAGLLKEDYVPTEAPNATGSMYVETYIEDDSERFTYIAQVPLVKNGDEILLYPDATVTDLRIEVGTHYSDHNQYIAGATVFAANTLNVGDAIRLTADLSDQNTAFRLVYHSGNQEYSAFITYDDAGDSILLTNNENNFT